MRRPSSLKTHSTVRLALVDVWALDAGAPNIEAITAIKHKRYLGCGSQELFLKIRTVVIETSNFTVF